MGGFRKVGAGGLSKSWSFWGAPNLEPRWPPDPPTWSQDNLLTPQLGAKMAPGPPTWSQDGPQSSNLEPRWPPDPPTWSLNDHQTLKSRHGGGARRQAVGYIYIYIHTYFKILFLISFLYIFYYFCFMFYYFLFSSFYFLILLVLLLLSNCLTASPATVRGFEGLVVI